MTNGSLRYHAPVSTRGDHMDATLFMLVLAVLTNVWYWQLLIPILAPLRLGILTIAGALVAFLMSPHRFDVFRDSWKRPVQVTLLIGVLAIIGGPFAIVRGEALEFLITIFVPAIALALLVAARVRSDYALDVLLGAMVVGGILYGFTLATAPFDSYGKPYGMPFYDANDGALVSLSTAFISTALFFRSRSTWKRILFALCALFYIFVVVKSGSRGAFLALAIAAAGFLVFSVTTSVGTRLKVATAGVALMLVAGNSGYWTLMKTILEPEKDYNWAGNSDTGRIEIWKRGLTFMAEDPILGAGASNYQNKQGRSEWARQLQAQGRGVPWQAAHNGYLQIGVELGIPGLLTFLAIIWLTMRNLWRSARWRHVPPRKRQGMELLLAGLVGFSVGTVFISSAYWAFFYVTIALCCAAVSIASRAPAALFQVPDTRAPHTGRASRRQRTQSRVAAVATARP